MPTIQINHLTYYYETLGNGEPLLLLHGFTGSVRNWDEIAPLLAHRFQVIMVDLPGHGRTAVPADPARYGMAQVAADLIQMMTTAIPAPGHDIPHPPLAPDSGFYLLGYSMGGRLALYIASHYPELIRALILESASPGLATIAERTERRQRDHALANRIEREGMAAFVDFWERLALWDSQQQLPPAARQRLRQLRLQNNPVGLANSLRGMGTAVQPALWSQLSDLMMPTLLITGELDRKFGQIGQEMASAISLARQEIVARAGHTVHLERPLPYVERIGRFLQNLADAEGDDESEGRKR